jgi:hypothetical protein
MTFRSTPYLRASVSAAVFKNLSHRQIAKEAGISLYTLRKYFLAELQTKPKRELSLGRQDRNHKRPAGNFRFIDRGFGSVRFKVERQICKKCKSRFTSSTKNAVFCQKCKAIRRGRHIIEIPCQKCGELFKATVRLNLTYQWPRFCSDECRHDLSSRMRICANPDCGREFTRPWLRAKRRGREGYFCSRSCQYAQSASRQPRPAKPPCKHCGAAVPKQRRSYCSVLCAQAMAHPKRKPKTCMCALCNIEFVSPTGHGMKCCDECRPIWNLTKRRERKRKARLIANAMLEMFPDLRAIINETANTKIPEELHGKRRNNLKARRKGQEKLKLAAVGRQMFPELKEIEI